jgi:hypothetical protein
MPLLTTMVLVLVLVVSNLFGTSTGGTGGNTDPKGYYYYSYSYSTSTVYRRTPSGTIERDQQSRGQIDTNMDDRQQQRLNLLLFDGGPDGPEGRIRYPSPDRLLLPADD